MSSLAWMLYGSMVSTISQSSTTPSATSIRVWGSSSGSPVWSNRFRNVTK